MSFDKLKLKLLTEIIRVLLLEYKIYMKRNVLIKPIIAMKIIANF